MQKRQKKNRRNRNSKNVKPSSPALVSHTGQVTRAVSHTGQVTSHRQNQPFYQLVVYDSRFAEVQERTHGGVCCVCTQRAYFMSTCQRCQVSKFCDRSCHLRHLKDVKQKITCCKYELQRSVLEYFYNLKKSILMSVSSKCWARVSQSLTFSTKVFILILRDRSRSNDNAVVNITFYINKLNQKKQLRYSLSTQIGFLLPSLIK